MFVTAALAAIVAGLFYWYWSRTMDVTFNYEPAAQREDGSPLPLEEIRFTRLYCDGELVAEEVGADGHITAALRAGEHTCYSTHVDLHKYESPPSNVMQKTVEF